jgi:two-component system, cell cycle sensor histidine kinase and response regulator CckA
MTSNAAANPGILPARLPQTILVIDDDPAMRAIFGFTLKAFGYLALVAGDGEEALQVARYHPEIRMIILDVVMAGLSGKQLAGQLQIELPKAVILFCSGHPPEMMSLQGIDLNSVHFMQKPCRPQELQRKVEELLVTR